MLQNGQPKRGKPKSVLLHVDDVAVDLLAKFKDAHTAGQDFLQFLNKNE